MRGLSWEVNEHGGEGIKELKVPPLIIPQSVPASAASLFAYELKAGFKGVRTRLKLEFFSSLICIFF